MAISFIKLPQSLVVNNGLLMSVCHACFINEEEVFLFYQETV